MRKRIAAAIMAFTMIVTLPFNVVTPNTDYKVAIESTQIYAAGASITVDKADEATAKKVHEKLMKGNELTLKVKGSAKAAAKTVSALKEEIKKVNKQGVVFLGSKGKSSGKYTKYKISKDEAQSYKYAVKFIDKLFSTYKKSVKNDEWLKTYIDDIMVYPDKDNLKLRLLYDYYVEDIMRYSIAEDAVYIGNEAKTTTSFPVADSSEDDAKIHSNHNNLVLKSIVWKVTHVYENGVVHTSEQVFDSLQDFPNGSIDPGESVDSPRVSYSVSPTVYVRSFEEFAALDEAKELAKLVSIPVESALIASLSTENFCDLSDAMKVYVIGKSRYFDCRKSRSGYGMVYKMIYYGKCGGKGMKTLYENKAQGVCQVYAAYECQVWDALGIKSYFCSNYAINHAWTVVKVKNSQGKVMWVPFDYGIGPAENLSVTAAVRKKYLKTEAMRFKLYLKGIKGAPSKKNYVTEDFN